jgi:hypothetical protein
LAARNRITCFFIGAFASDGSRGREDALGPSSSLATPATGRGGEEAPVSAALALRPQRSLPSASSVPIEAASAPDDELIAGGFIAALEARAGSEDSHRASHLAVRRPYASKSDIVRFGR